MPEELLTRRLLLPELSLRRTWFKPGGARTHLAVEKTSPMEVCPRCATPSTATYDRRTVVVKDAPLRDKHVLLHVRKRRFSCKPCRRPFTEPVSGIKKGRRTTERYRKSVLWACENFSDLSAVRRAYRCSAGFLQTMLYEQLELRRRLGPDLTHPVSDAVSQPGVKAPGMESRQRGDLHRREGGVAGRRGHDP
jgi:hypothetical protein